MEGGERVGLLGTRKEKLPRTKKCGPRPGLDRCLVMVSGHFWKMSGDVLFEPNSFGPGLSLSPSSPLALMMLLLLPLTPISPSQMQKNLCQSCMHRCMDRDVTRPKLCPDQTTHGFSSVGFRTPC